MWLAAWWSYSWSQWVPAGGAHGGRLAEVGRAPARWLRARRRAGPRAGVRRCSCRAAWRRTVAVPCRAHALASARRRRAQPSALAHASRCGRPPAHGRACRCLRAPARVAGARRECETAPRRRSGHAALREPWFEPTRVQDGRQPSFLRTRVSAFARVRAPGFADLLRPRRRARRSAVRMKRTARGGARPVRRSVFCHTIFGAFVRWSGRDARATFGRWTDAGVGMPGFDSGVATSGRVGSAW